MANGAFKFKDNSGNVVSFISGSGPNISFSGGTLDLSGMTGLTLGNLTLSGTTQNALSASHAASYLLTSSFNTYSSSFAITGSNLFKGDQTISGSVIPSVTNTYDLGSPTNNFRHLYLSSASLYIDGTKVLGSTSQELQITTDVGQSFKILEAGSDNITLQSADGNIEFKTSGGGDVVIDPTNGIIGLKGTVTVYTGNKVVSSDGNSIQFGNGITVTGSIVSTVTPLVSGSSQIIYSGLTGIPSGIISGSAQLPSGIISGSAQLPSGLISGSSQITSQGYATTGSNNFQGTQTITGSLYISSDLVVQGSSSLQNITASAVSIGANTVNLNTANPAIRFAGLNIFDSGSIGGSGSFLYDAVEDEFIFVHRGDNSNITSSVVLMGPQTYNNVGNEIYPTANRLLKGVGNEHIGDSIVTETNGGIGISGSLSITGSIVATGTSLWSGSAQLPSGIVSGSAQVDVMSTTNIARLATTGSNTFTSNQIVSGSVSVSGSLSIGGSTSTSQLNVFTSSVSTQNVMSEFYNGDFTSGTRNFIRVRNNINAGSTMSSYFGQGQDGKTYIVSNDFTKNHIVIDGNSTFVGINKNTPNTQLDVNGNTTVSGSIVTTSNVGVGVTPSAWSGAYSALQVGGMGSISTTTGGATFTHLTNGAFFNGTNWIYSYTSVGVARYTLTDSGGGTHQWFISPNSGTAGNAITFTTAMTLNASGNLGLGTTDTQGFRLAVDGPNVSQGDVTTTIRVFDTTSATTGTGGGISFAGYFSGTSSIINTFSYIKGGKENSTGGDYASYLSFGTRINGASPTERLRITSLGTVRPAANGTQDLGTASLRWGTIYTSDLSLSNGIGDYTIVEGEEKLYLYNNKNNKVYSFVLQEEDPLTATPKKS